MLSLQYRQLKDEFLYNHAKTVFKLLKHGNYLVSFTNSKNMKTVTLTYGKHQTKPTFREKSTQVEELTHVSRKLLP